MNFINGRWFSKIFQAFIHYFRFIHKTDQKNENILLYDLNLSSLKLFNSPFELKLYQS
jgi:hypothetical protein